MSALREINVLIFKLHIKIMKIQIFARHYYDLLEISMFELNFNILY